MLRVATAAGYAHSCVLLSDGNVECWGANGSGELGRGTFTETEFVSTQTPGVVTGLSGATAIAAGAYHTCAIVAGGTVKCWGSSAFGSLGNGMVGPDAAVPVTVPNLSGVVSIAAGWYVTCAVLADGTVQCWGDRNSGVLGYSQVFPDDVLSPVAMPFLSNVAAIAIGGDHACARLKTLAVVCWGRNNAGQLGDGTTNDSVTAVTVPGVTSRELAAGIEHTCALQNNTSVRCWGGNSHGSLGDGTTNRSLTPVFAQGLSQVQSLSSGATTFNTCAVRQFGNIACWGDNDFGQLGNGIAGPSLVPSFIPGIVTAASSGLGLKHTCTVTTSGLVLCWGANIQHQLGVSTDPAQLSTTPLPVPGYGFGVSVPGQSCRAAAGPCDVAEACDGFNAACPADTFVANMTTCRPSAGDCDVAETCTGSSAACPPDGFAGTSQVCRPAAGICDRAETCSGTGPNCPGDQFAGQDFCRASAGPCDLAETCTGSSPDCPPDKLAQAGEVCRGANYSCDIDEVCSGTSADCPADVFAPAGTPCNVPSNPCYSTEACSGTGLFCPSSTRIPGCGGNLAGTFIWNGSPLTGSVTQTLKVTGYLLPGGPDLWSSAVDPATGRYDSGVQFPGQYRVFFSTLACGESGGYLGDIRIDVSANQATNFDADVTGGAAMVTGTVTVNGTPTPATILLDDGDGPCEAPVSTDVNGHFAVLLPGRDYTGEVLDAAGAPIAALSYDSATGQTVLLTQNGGSCSDNGACGSGLCVDGVCCENECGGGDQNDCLACSTKAGGRDNGKCTERVEASPCGEDGNACTQDVCDGVSFDCQHPAGNAGTTCSKATGCKLAAVCSGSSDICPAATTLDPKNCQPVPSGATAINFLGSHDNTNLGNNPVGSFVLFFQGLSTPGTATVVETSDGPEVPGEYKTVGATSPHYWHIETDAKYDTVIVCMRYDVGWIGGVEAMLQFWHYDTGQLKFDNVTGSGFPDVGAHVICTKPLTKLSPFALVLPPPRAADTTPPILPPVPDVTAYATSTAGASVRYTVPTATDETDGPVAVGCTPPPGSIFPPGKTTVTCSASDLSGNKASVSFEVWVRFQAPTDGTFFLQPINPDGSSVFKRGSTIPVKFKLQGPSAGIANLGAHLSVAKVSNGVTGTYVEADSTAVCDAGDTFRYDPTAKQYIFNLSTKPMSVGTWSLRVDLGDRVDHTVKVSLR